MAADDRGPGPENRPDDGSRAGGGPGNGPDGGSDGGRDLPVWIDLPPVWLAVALILVWGIGQALPLHVFGALGAGGGVVLIGLGLALMTVATLQLLLRRTTFLPHRDAAALVTGGVFRLSRNPIYLGDALVLAGFILWRDVALALPLLPLFMALIAGRFIRAEEARLRARFGARFEAWAARTRRWL